LDLKSAKEQRDKYYNQVKKESEEYTIPVGYPTDVNLQLEVLDNNIYGLPFLHGDIIADFYNYYDSYSPRGALRYLFQKIIQ